LPGGKGGRRIRREDEVNLETNQIRCESCEPLDSRVRASVLDGDVSILRIAKLTQPLPEGVELHSRLGGVQRTGYHQTNPIPAPIVGAGLPGLIFASGVLLALARRRQKIVLRLFIFSLISADGTPKSRECDPI
jgi:hypothetical protein